MNDHRQPVLVTGANGRTGRAVVSAAAARGAVVRALVRDSAQGVQLAALGAAQIATGDLSDSSSLERAAANCAGVIHIGPPLDPMEFEYSRNMLTAAKRVGVSHFVYYSVMHPLCGTLRHHGLKLDVERRVIESGLSFAIVQPIRYMQHLEPIWGRVTEEGVHPMPFGTAARFSLADLADLAAATARAALDPALRWGTYELAGPEALSMEDSAVLLPEELGRPVEARQVTPQAFAATANMRANRLIQLMTMNDHYDRHGFRGSPAVLEMLLGRPATRFRDYVRRLIAADRAA